MIEYYVRNDTCIIGGKIVDFVDGVGKAAGKLVTVTLKGTSWNPDTRTNEEKSVYVDCWNNDTDHLADMIKKFHKKSFVTFLCKKKDKENHYTAQKIKTKGVWHFPQEGEFQERNILVGLITKVEDSRVPGQYTQVTMPINVFRKNESGIGYDTITQWADIRFWDNEPSGGRNDAKNAKIMAPTAEGKKTAVIICAQNIANETRKNPLYNGKRFEIVS